MPLEDSGMEGRLTRLEAIVERDHGQGNWTAEQVLRTIEGLFAEKERALEKADRERELSAAALRAEQQRAVHDLDERLRDLVSTQIEQIRSALVSANDLEMERMLRLDAKVNGNLALLEAGREANAHRIAAFEETVTSRFATVNEFRGALDDLGKTMATRRELETATSATSERIDELAKVGQELRSRLDVGPAALGSIQSRLDIASGEQAGGRYMRTESKSNITTAAAVIGAFVALLGFFATYLITKNSVSPSAPAPLVVTVTAPATP